VLVPERSGAAGKTLAEVGLGERSGVTVIAVVRGGRSPPNPSADFILSAGDILVLLGSHQQLDEAMRLLEPSVH